MLSRCILSKLCSQSLNAGQMSIVRSGIIQKPSLISCYSTVSRQLGLHSKITKQLCKPIAYSLQRTTSTIFRNAPGRFPDITPRAQKMVGQWLLTCAGMCFGAVIIGGITRLTESGLSMTQWHLIKGMKPPTTDEEWKAEFERYQTFPEFKFVHSDITLDEFKNIFFWEYLHRMWGRTIGVVFALPALYFLKKGYITKSLKPRLAIYGTLLLSQGLLGWYMVKSGLEDKPDVNDVPRVSQYRLCAHLSSALVLYSLFLWQGFTHLLQPEPLAKTLMLPTLRKVAHGSMALVFFTAMSGAFVAGLDAGLTYNSWPKMADRWVPDDILAFSPKWKNFFENPTTVQFNHRHLGEFTAASMIGIWMFTRKLRLPYRAQVAVNSMALMACIQVTLGVIAIIQYVPVHVGAMHQAGAVSLLSFCIWFAHELRKVPK